VVSVGQGSLAERGAGFLDLLYLSDQEGTGLLGRLTRTTRTGVANVEAETGRPWGDLLVDWWSATYLDGLVPATGRLQYPSVDLRAFLGDNPFPLSPIAVSSLGVSDEGSLWSSSVRYYLLAPPPGGTLSRAAARVLSFTALTCATSESGSSFPGSSHGFARPRSLAMIL